MDIVATSRLAGEHCWVESRLFELLGVLMHTVDNDAMVVALGERCSRHGEHAEAWRARIASIPGIDPDALVRAPTAIAPHIERLEATLGEPNRCLTLLDDDVLPAVLNAYGDHRRRLDARIDGPTARLLDELLTR
jgi:hypothetical protein